MRSRLSILLGLCALVFVAAIVALRATRTRQRAGVSPGGAMHGSGSDTELADGARSVRESREAQPGGAATVSSAEASTGGLRLHVFDETTKAPLAGVECIVYSERDYDGLYGTCTTDAEGRAHIEGLPANAILVEARRKPPHASGFAGVWLKGRETKDVEIALGSGGTITGRVVDDLGVPIESAEILLGDEIAPRFLPAENYLLSKRVATKSGAEGRFAIEHVVSQPREVWIIDGELRPERWDGVRVLARFESRRTWAIAQVKTGETTNVGNVVIPRAGTWSGHVVDARGTPIEGALVSPVSSRVMQRDHGTFRTGKHDPLAIWPGREGFQLLPGEALTDDAGSFRIEGAQDSQMLTVWTRAGILERFPLPKLEPGATKDALELCLKDWSILEIELVDAEGHLVSRSNPRFDWGRTQFSGSHAIVMSVGRLVASFVLADDSQFQAQVIADGDDVFRVQTIASLASVRHVHLELGGYLPIHDDVATPLAASDRRRYTVHETPSIRLHVRVDEQDETTRAAREPGRIYLHACMIDPEHAALESNLDHGHICCGLGSSWTSRLDAGQYDAELPVRVVRPFWIHVTAVPPGSNAPTYAAHVGPFQPGDASGAVHEIVVPRIDVKPTLTKSPPPASMPGVTPGTGMLVVRIVDAVSRKSIRGAKLVLNEPDPRPHDGYSTGGWAWADREDQLVMPAARVGHWRAIATADAHIDGDPIDVTIVEGTKLDLGTIALAAAPQRTLVLVEADGSSVPQRTSAEIFDADSPRHLGQARDDTGERGRLVVNVALPDRILVDVRESREGLDLHAPAAEQRVLVEHPGDGDVHITLAPWRVIEVRIAGEASTLPGASLSLSLLHATSAFGPTCDTLDSDASSRCRAGWLLELEPAADGLRRFRGETAAGRYRISATSALFQVENKTIDIRDLPGIQTFELTSTR